MENIFHGLILKLEFLKVQYWDYFFFLIYINDLSDNLITNSKLLVDSTPPFSIVHDQNGTANDLNNDLAKINDCAYQWKINFSPDPFKQAQEVLFSRKIESKNHPCLQFNNNPVNQRLLRKHLGRYLDQELDFLEHLKNIEAKVNNLTALLWKLQTIPPRPTLLTIYKAFIRPHLDYGDTIYDQAYNDYFHQKLESVQYNAALAITGITVIGNNNNRFGITSAKTLVPQTLYFLKTCYKSLLNILSVLFLK